MEAYIIYLGQGSFVCILAQLAIKLRIAIQYGMPHVCVRLKAF